VTLKRLQLIRHIKLTTCVDNLTFRRLALDNITHNKLKFNLRQAEKTNFSTITAITLVTNHNGKATPQQFS
jgi:hypothetical protein